MNIVRTPAEQLKEANSNIKKAKKRVADCSLQILKKLNEAEIECVTKVLTEYLGHAPKDEDFKKCTQITESNSSANYILCHLDVKLGMITKDIPDFKVSFNPNKIEFKQ